MRLAGQLDDLAVAAAVELLVVGRAVHVLQLGAERLDVVSSPADAFEQLGDLLAEAARGPAEMGLEDLADVHARRHAERVEDDVGRRPVLEERHVLLGQDAADDALVAVAAGHLVARLQLALHRDEHLDHLEHARRQLVAPLDLLDAIVELRLDDAFGAVILGADRLEIGLDLVVLDRELPPFVRLDRVHRLGVDHRALLDALGRRGGGLAEQHLAQARIGGALQNGALVLGVLAQAILLLGLDGAGAVVDVDAVAVEHPDLDHRAGDARRQAKRGVANVRRLLAEDGAEQLLLRRHRAFALRRDLAGQDVARLDLGADIDDAGLVEVAQRFLADVRDVAGDVLRPELGVAGHHLELFDVDRGEDVVLHDPLGDQDADPRNYSRSTA